MFDDPNVVLHCEKIDKIYPGTKALDQVSFDLLKGKVNVLIGENGAGKSTLMKMIAGIEQPSAGKMYMDGQEVYFKDTNAARAKGIGIIHQELSLFPNMTVYQNIFMGHEIKKNHIIQWKAMNEEANKLLKQLNADFDSTAEMGTLSVAQQQMVEIAKALSTNAKIIILDEPTAVLTPQEAERLFEILNNLKQDGKSLVFISHKLNEVMAISDRISVMRQGQYMGTVNKEETSPLDLTKRMIGREVFLNIDKAYSEAGDTILEVQDVWIPSQKETSKIRGMSLHVKAGEIVGVAGIDGNGQSELVEAITGLRKVEKGKILLCGKDITNQSPRKVRESGLSHIPEDRNTRGLNRAMTIEENLIAVRLDQPPFTRGIMMNKSGQDTYAKEMVEQFDIRPADYNLPTSSLSGGNAQKVVVAREVSLGNKLLVASQPTRGVDIGAIELIRNTLEKAKKAGAGVLLVSAELEEIISLSDRIVVIHEGKITGEMRADEANENNLGLLMMGGTDTGKDGEAAV